jgi:CBS domain-containing protein
MKVSDVMTRKVYIANPNHTLREAARKMAEFDVGVLPVGENDRLVGMITDRDIVVRGVANGKGPVSKIHEVMSREVKYCFEDEDIEDVARNMADQQIRRLPVVNRNKRLIGIISLADLASSDQADLSGEALSGISQPGGAHCQSDKEASPSA